MWTLQYFKPNEAKYFCSKNIEPDDVVFVAVLKKGPTTHIGDFSMVRCIHLANESNSTNLVLPMSILDASSLSASHPSFSEGLMGKWKLVSPKKGRLPFIKILEIYDNANEFLDSALKESNPSWAREPYEKLL
jgi:hypothetical protein